MAARWFNFLVGISNTIKDIGMKSSKPYLRLSLMAIFGAFVTQSLDAAELIQINSQNVNTYINTKKSHSPKTAGDFEILEVHTSVLLANNVLKTKYEQKYQGIPVLGSVMSSSKINGEESEWWGSYLNNIENDLPSVIPALTAEDAQQIAGHYFNINSVNITQRQAKLYIKQNNLTNKAELVYWVVMLSEDGQFVSRPNMFLNANTGEVIAAWDGLTTRDAKGPGGNQKVGKYYYGQDFGPLVVSDACEMKTENVATYNMNGRTSGETLYKFTCPENTYKAINGAYAPLNDAHYFGNVVFNMYKNLFNIRPIKSQLKLRVHYGVNFENAFWDGQQMTFGDGASRFYPMSTALDVMAHEVSHGVTEQNSGLIYQYQSGGINEAFSDMAGEMAEYFMNVAIDKENDWLVGNAVVKGGNGSSLRYFEDPTRDGVSIGHARDYRDDLDVHHTSGVYNKAFYTLSHKDGWGIQRAFGSFLLANQIYWQSNATYNTAACGVNKAAKDLGYQTADVIAAFKAVGVDATCGIQPPNPDPDPEPTPGDEIQLQNGKPVQNIEMDADIEKSYFIQVPSVPGNPYPYRYLNIFLFNQVPLINVAQLYVRYESENAFMNHTFNADSNNNESILFYYPSAGIYHVLLKGQQKGTVSLQADYQK